MPVPGSPLSGVDSARVAHLVKATVAAANSPPTPPSSGFLQAHGLSTSDAAALLSLLVSVGTLLFYLSSGYLNKRIDLRARRFDKLCFEPVEAAFKGLDALFATHKADSAAKHKEAIAESLSEVNYLLIQLKGIYPTLDFAGIERHCDEFSELYFESQPADRVMDYFASYFYAKTQVLNSLFNYAIDDHIFIPLLPRPGRWWRSYQQRRKTKAAAKPAPAARPAAAQPATPG